MLTLNHQFLMWKYIGIGYFGFDQLEIININQFLTSTRTSNTSTTRTKTTSPNLQYCEGYFTSLGYYKAPEKCNDQQYCCGSCSNRHCCDDAWEALNQTGCVEKCNSYKDSSGKVIKSKVCNTTQPFCCGTCKRRTCCNTNSTSVYLDQIECETKDSDYVP
jgi:hypothetical protein